jgi:hypothetical protein
LDHPRSPSNESRQVFSDFGRRLSKNKLGCQLESGVVIVQRKYYPKLFNDSDSHRQIFSETETG